MTRRGGIYLAGDAETLLDELAETPAGTVTGEHAEVVEVQFAVAVSIGDLLVINLAQPVVCGDSAGVGEDKTADGIGDGAVFLNAPVLDLEVLVNGVLIVKVGGFGVAQFFSLLTVEDVCLCNALIAAA